MTKADKTALLGEAKVGPLFLRLAAPAVLAQMVSMLNNVIDRAWVGHIPNDGMLSLGAVGISLPITHLFLSFILMIASGMAPVVSIMLGKGQRSESGRVSGACFGLAVAINVAIAAGLTVFADPLLLSFGAGEASLPFARSYLKTLAWGTPFFNTLLLLIMWFNAQGYVAEGVRLSVMSVVVNAVFDPVFIFLCHMGVTGAALATNLGAAVALAYGIRHAIRDDRLIRFGAGDLVPLPRLWLPSVMLGLSTFLNVALDALSQLFFNIGLQKYGGDRAVAAMAMLSLPVFIVMSLSMGLSMGAQPIVSYNYGRGAYDRVRSASRLFIAAAFACSFAVWAVAMVSPSALWKAFTGDAALLAYTTDHTRLFYAAMLLSGIQFAHLYIIKFLGLVKMSLFLSVLRRLVLLLPLIYVLPAVLDWNKVNAVLLASPISDAASFLGAAICYFCVMRRISKTHSFREALP